MGRLRLHVYTSSKGRSLQRVAYDIARSAGKRPGGFEATVIESPALDPDAIDSCDACIVVTAFDLAWCIPFFFVAYEHLSRGKAALVYATIEGRVMREMVREWVVRDLRYVANSWYTRGKLEEVGARVVDVVHHGVDAGYVRSFRERGERFREQFGKSEVLVGYIAQGHERKGHDLFSQVVREVEARERSVRFVILTDRKGKQHYEGTDALVLDSFGQLDDSMYYAIVNAIDVYAHGSLSEGFGLPVLEAMAAGKPVVHPDYAPLSEITTGTTSVRVPIREILLVRVGGSGILFELKVYDPKAFADRLLSAVRLVSEGGSRLRAMRRRLIERARKFDCYELYGRLVERLLSLKAGV